MNPTTANLEKIDAWIGRLAEMTDAAAQGEELARYMAMLARFWTYSARNCVLIASQRPAATRVASRKTWEGLGRQIAREEWRNSVQILCPHFRKERDRQTGEVTEVLTHFSTGYVYDLAQTEGEPLPEVAWHQTLGCFELYRSLTGAARRFGLTITEQSGLEPGLHGWSEGNGRIVINSEDAHGTRCETLLHELAHELCHDLSTRKAYSRAMLEGQADSIAYCCCMALGIPAPNTPNYLAFFRVDSALLLSNLDAIRAGVVRVLRAVEWEEEVAGAA